MTWFGDSGGVLQAEGLPQVHSVPSHYAPPFPGTECDSPAVGLSSKANQLRK